MHFELASRGNQVRDAHCFPGNLGINFRVGAEEMACIVNHLALVFSVLSIFSFF